MGVPALWVERYGAGSFLLCRESLVLGTALYLAVLTRTEGVTAQGWLGTGLWATSPSCIPPVGNPS